ncbi:hypothetical protein C8Q74DRAFT_1446688, partial [Fomes fomentarius]
MPESTSQSQSLFPTAPPSLSVHSVTDDSIFREEPDNNASSASPDLPSILCHSDKTRKTAAPVKASAKYKPDTISPQNLYLGKQIEANPDVLYDDCLAGFKALNADAREPLMRNAVLQDNRRRHRRRSTILICGAVAYVRHTICSSGTYGTRLVYIHVEA